MLTGIKCFEHRLHRSRASLSITGSSLNLSLHRRLHEVIITELKRMGFLKGVRMQYCKNKSTLQDFCCASKQIEGVSEKNPCAGIIYRSLYVSKLSG